MCLAWSLSLHLLPTKIRGNKYFHFSLGVNHLFINMDVTCGSSPEALSQVKQPAESTETILGGELGVYIGGLVLSVSVFTHKIKAWT